MNPLYNHKRMQPPGQTHFASEECEPGHRQNGEPQDAKGREKTSSAKRRFRRASTYTDKICNTDCTGGCGSSCDGSCTVGLSFVGGCDSNCDGGCNTGCTGGCICRAGYGGSACSECTNSAYKPSSGNHACTQRTGCSQGSFWNKYSTTTLGDCNACQLNEYNNGADSYACYDCPQCGRKKQFVGTCGPTSLGDQSSCNACIAGTVDFASTPIVDHRRTSCTHTCGAGTEHGDSGDYQPSTGQDHCLNVCQWQTSC